MTITQKIHGTNAQIYIYEEDGKQDLKVGCRSRWITPENDNFGFAKFVYENKAEFIEKLGIGRHFGEWAGPGINLGEGLSEKKFFLFNPKMYINKILPFRTHTVPILHDGKLSMNDIDSISQKLLEFGSAIVDGYMKVEGIVIDIDGKLYKKVFDPEETKWRKKDKIKTNRTEALDISYLLQPIRLEKLLSRDEKYIREYPYSLSIICKEYIEDLMNEGQITGDDEHIKLIKKTLGRNIFPFIKSEVLERIGGRVVKDDSL